MKRNDHLRLWTCLLLLPFGLTQANLVDTGDAEISVRLAAALDRNHVPLNRSVTLTVQVSWRGTPGRIAIREIEGPMLSNLEITGTASATHVTAGESVKEIIYTLTPSNLGMSYIESVGLTYEDQSTGAVHLLKTERIGVEVLPAVKEKTQSPGIRWIWFLIGMVCAGGAAAFALFKQRQKAREASIDPSSAVCIEEAFLAELQENISLENPNRRDAISALSRLFRRYLADKFNIPARESTTEDLLKILGDSEIDASLVRKSEQLFRKADVILFTGQDVSQAELDTAYTTVETVFESELAGAHERANAGESVNKRRSIFR